MNTSSTFQQPLRQTAAVLAAGIIFFCIFATSGPGIILSAITSFFMGVFYTIMFPIALSLGISFCIGVLFAIFLASIALVSLPQAKIFYKEIKEKLTVYYKELRAFITALDIPNPMTRFCKCRG